jgi:hypothetical protein
MIQSCIQGTIVATIPVWHVPKLGCPVPKSQWPMKKGMLVSSILAVVVTHPKQLNFSSIVIVLWMALCRIITPIGLEPQEGIIRKSAATSSHKKRASNCKSTLSTVFVKSTGVRPGKTPTRHRGPSGDLIIEHMINFPEVLDSIMHEGKATSSSKPLAWRSLERGIEWSSPEFD